MILNNKKDLYSHMSTIRNYPLTTTSYQILHFDGYGYTRILVIFVCVCKWKERLMIMTLSKQ
jgi:hypothetical protein